MAPTKRKSSTKRPTAKQSQSTASDVQEQAPALNPSDVPAQNLAFVRDETLTQGPWTEVVTPLTIIESVPADEEGDVSRWLSSVQPTVAHVQVPGPTEEARIVANAARNHQDGRDVHFEPLPGVVLMFGYDGLMRVFNGIHHVHIATLADQALMDEQQLYDAVMAAGGKR